MGLYLMSLQFSNNNKVIRSYIYLKIYVLLKQTLPNITFTLTDIT